MDIEIKTGGIGKVPYEDPMADAFTATHDLSSNYFGVWINLRMNLYSNNP